MSDFADQLASVKQSLAAAKHTALNSSESPMASEMGEALQEAKAEGYQLGEETFADPLAVVQDNGIIRQHADGSYSVRSAKGEIIYGLSEEEANNTAQYQLQRSADIEAGATDNPLSGIKETLIGGLGDIGQGLYEKATNQSYSHREEFDRINTQIDRDNAFAKMNPDSGYSQQTKLTESEWLQYQSIKAKEEAGIPLTPQEGMFTESAAFKKIFAAEGEYLKDAASQDKVSSAIDAFKNFGPVSTKADDLASSMMTARIAEEQGTTAAVQHAVLNDYAQLLKQGVESTPYMVLYTVGGPITQAGILTGFAQSKIKETTDDFKELNGREPSSDELSRIGAWATASVVFEKFGDLAAVKAIPAARLGRVTKLYNGFQNSLPSSLKTLDKYAKPITRPAMALSGEGLSGGLTNVAEQQALHGEVKDTAAVAIAATQEAMGTPGGLATMASAKASYSLAKKANQSAEAARTKEQAAQQVSDLQQEKESIDTELASLEDTLDVDKSDKLAARKVEIDQELAAYDLPEAAPVAEDLETAPQDVDENNPTPAEDTSVEVDPEQPATQLVPDENAPRGSAQRLAHVVVQVQERKDDPITDAEFAELRDELYADREEAETLDLLTTEVLLNAMANRKLSQSQIKELTELVKHFEPFINSAKEGDVLGSIGDYQTATSDQRANATADQKSLFEWADKANVAAEKLPKDNSERTVNKTAAAELTDSSVDSVNADVLSGTDEKYTGFATYVAAISATMKDASKDKILREQNIKRTLEKMKTHRDNTVKKAKAFRDATLLAASNPKDTIVVRGVQQDPDSLNDRNMNWDVELYSPDAQNVPDQAESDDSLFVAEPGRGHGGLRKTSSVIQSEAEYGEAAYQLSTQYDSKAFDKAAENPTVQLAKKPDAQADKKEAKQEPRKATTKPAEPKPIKAEPVVETKEPAADKPVQETESTGVFTDGVDLPSTITEAELDVLATEAQKNRANTNKKNKGKKNKDNSPRKALPEIDIDQYKANRFEAVIGALGKKFTDLVSVNMDSRVATMPATFETRESFETFVKDKFNLSKEETQSFVDMYEAFTEGYAKVLKPFTQSELLWFPQSLLVDPSVESTGELLPQVTFSAFIGALEWLMINTRQGNVLRSGYEQKSFLYGSFGKTLTPDEQHMVDQLGYSYAFAAQDIGQSAVTALGLSPKGKEGKEYLARLAPTLGMLAIEAMDSAGKINVDWDFKFKFDKADPARSFQTGQQYRHIKNVPEAVSDDLKKATKQVTKFLFDEPVESGPLQSPKKSVPQKIRGTLGGVAQFAQDTLKKLQANPATEMQSAKHAAAIANLGKDGQKVLEELADVKEISPLLHPDLAGPQEAANKSKTSAIKEFLNAYEKGSLKEFYFEYSLMNQSRIMMKGDVNPQASHVTRALVTTGKPVRYHDKNINLFKYSVLLATGYDIDKENLGAIDEAFDQLINDPVVLDTMDALATENWSEYAVQLSNLKAKYQDGDMSLINVAPALLAHREYVTGQDNSFTSDIPLEVDGITNGFANTLMQFPVYEKLEEYMNYVGVYFGSDKKHLVDGIWEDASERNDMYTMIGNSFAEVFENDVPPTLVESRDAITALHSNLKTGNARKFAKSPFMIRNYQAGVPRIVEDISKELVDDIKIEASNLRIQFNEAKTEEQKSDAIQAQKEFLEHVAKLGGVYGPKDLTKSGLGVWMQSSNPKAAAPSLNVNTIISRASDVLEPVMEQVFGEVLGDTEVFINSTVAGIELLYFVFDHKFNKAMNAKYGQEQNVTQYQTEEVIKDVLMEVIPQYKGPLQALSGETDSSFLDLTKLAKESVQWDIVKYPFKAKERMLYRNHNKFVAPGVQPFVRLIHNLDSSALHTALNKTPSLLGLHDAIYGNPEDVLSGTDSLNKAFFKYNKNHSILGGIAASVKEAVDTLSDEDYKDINDNYLDNSYENSRAEKGALLATVSDTAEGIERTAQQLEKVRSEFYGRFEKEGRSIHQYYLPDFDALAANAPEFYSEKQQSILDTVRNKAVAVFKKDYLVGVDNSALRASYLSLISKGVGQASKVLQQYSPEYIDEYLNIGKTTDRVRSKLTQLESKMGIEKGAGTRILKSLLTDGPASRWYDDAVNKFKTAIALDNYLRSVEAELEQLAFPGVDFSNLIEDGREEVRVTRDELKSLEGLDRENPETVLTADISADNVKTFIKTLNRFEDQYYSSAEEKAEHLSVLNKALDIVQTGLKEVGEIQLTQENITGIAQGEYDAAKEAVRISVPREAPPSAAGQSPKEVYAHEMIHAVTVHALRKYPALKTKIERVMGEIAASSRADGGYKIFLEGLPGPITDADVRAARQQYNYLFNNDKNAKNAAAEFLAYALTNKGMSKYLKGKRLQKERNKGIIGGLLAIFDQIMDVFRSSIRGSVANDKYSEVVALAEQLAGKQARHEHILYQVQHRMFAATKEVNKKIQDVANNVIARSHSRTAKNTIFSKVVGSAGQVGKFILSDNATIALDRVKASRHISRALRLGLNEITGDNGYSASQVNLLLDKLNTIDRERHGTEREIIQWFDSIWKSTKGADMPVRTRQYLTDVFLRTDLAALRHAKYSNKSIVDILVDSDRTRISKEQSDLLAKLKVTSASPMVADAKELGKHMALGVTGLSMASMNTYGIFVKHGRKMPSSAELGLLDAFISLEALKHTDSGKVAHVRKLAKAELAADKSDNGIFDILDSHLAYVNESRKNLFENDPIHMRKGYIVERVDNLTDIRIGKPDDKLKMRVAGYTESYDLPSVPGTKLKNRVMYVSRHMPEVRHVAGLMSTENMRSSGNSLRELLESDPAYQNSKGIPDSRAIQATINSVAKKEMANSGKPSVTGLRPITDAQGNVTDFRIMMDHETKEKILKPDLEFQNVFAHMQSSMVAKVNTTAHDKHVINSLVREQVTVMPKFKSGFVDILDPKSPYAYQYNVIPDHIKKYMEQYAIDGKFMVREDIIYKVFGYRAFDLSNADFLQSDKMLAPKVAARMAHYMLRSAVGYAKTLIVLATPDVIMNNIYSNISQLTLDQIPLSYSAAKLKEGYVLYERYRENEDEIRTLRRKIKTKRLAVNSAEALQLRQLVLQNENNPIHRLTKAGLNSIIAEDYNAASTDGYISRIGGGLENFFEKHSVDKKYTTPVSTVGKTLFMARGSAPRKFMQKTVQLTDFLSRYVMMEYDINENKMDPAKAKQKAIESFVLFDENLPPWVEALESLGAVLFSSFYLRTQRVAKRIAMTNPVGLATSAVLEEASGLPTTGIVSSTMLGLEGPSVLQHGNIADKITTLPLTAALADLYD